MVNVLLTYYQHINKKNRPRRFTGFGYDAHEDQVNQEEILLWQGVGLWMEVKGEAVKIHEKKERDAWKRCIERKRRRRRSMGTHSLSKEKLLYVTCKREDKSHIEFLFVFFFFLFSLKVILPNLHTQEAFSWFWWLWFLE